MLTRLLIILLIGFQCSYAQDQKQTYPIVDTGISEFYSDNTIIKEPKSDEHFYGQDAHYLGNQPSYTNNDDGTITENVAGLMWEHNLGEKMTLEKDKEKCATI